MTHAFLFGRQLRVKTGFQLGPKPTPAAPSAPQAPAAPTPPAPAPQKPDQHGGMFGRAGYLNTLSRWYNPWTTQKVESPEEKMLMRAGQAGLGTAALAGTGAAGLAYAAPGLASTPLSALPSAVMGGGGTGATAATAGGAAATNPTVQERAQQMFPTVSGALNSAQQFGSQVASRVSNLSGQAGLRLDSARDRINSVGENIAQRIPEPLRNAYHAYHHYIGEPAEQAGHIMGGNTIGSPTNGITSLANGNPLGAVPHSYHPAIEGAHALEQQAHGLFPGGHGH